MKTNENLLLLSMPNDEEKSNTFFCLVRDILNISCGIFPINTQLQIINVESRNVSDLLFIQITRIVFIFPIMQYFYTVKPPINAPLQ